MDQNQLKLNSILIDQLDLVVQIHLDAFEESFLSKVISVGVREYYEWLMTPPNVCYAIGVFDGDELLGFCYAGVFRNAEVHFIKENISFLLGQIIKKTLALVFESALEKSMVQFGDVY